MPNQIKKNNHKNKKQEELKGISQMFIDGILGRDFARALSFYLSSFGPYLETMKSLA